MNVFNRIFTTVSLVCVAIFGAAVLITPSEVLSFINSFASVIHVTFSPGISDVSRVALRLLIALILISVCLTLVWLETRRGGSRHVDVSKSSGGQIRIYTSDVEARIEQQVDAISGVVTCRVRVSERDRAVIAKLDVHATPGTDLLSKGEEAAAITRIVVQDQLGLKLKEKPIVTMRSSKMKSVTETVVKTKATNEKNAGTSDKA